MQQLRTNEVALHPSSKATDPNGRLFEWQGQLYRAIDQRHAAFCRDLFSKGVIDRLSSKGLIVDTELQSLVLDGYELVLKHRKIPFVSYPYEWTGTMLKDAALLQLDLELELLAYDLTLQDAHPWNIVFDGAQPVFTDIGSIIPVADFVSWEANEEFFRFFLRPLQLFAANQTKLARWLLHDHTGIAASDLEQIGPPTFRRAARSLKQRTLKSLREHVRKTKPLYKLARTARDTVRPRPAPGTTANKIEAIQSQVRAMRQQIEPITLPQEQTLWSDYYERTSFPSFTDSADWTPKHTSVVQAMRDLKPATVLDVACNRGWFCQMATKLSSQAVGFDYDDSAVTQLYRDAKEQKLPIFPAVMDLLRPSPGDTWLGRGWAVPATRRFKCDMVLALAITHHLVYRSSILLRFPQIVEMLSSFTKRWLVVEFVPKEDEHVSKMWTEGFGWYTLDNFIRELEREFRMLRQLPSHPSPRVILLCERK